MLSIKRSLFSECTVAVSTFSSKPKTHGVREVSGDLEKATISRQMAAAHFQFWRSQVILCNMCPLWGRCRAETMQLPGGLLGVGRGFWKNYENVWNLMWTFWEILLEDSKMKSVKFCNVSDHTIMAKCNIFIVVFTILLLEKSGIIECLSLLFKFEHDGCCALPSVMATLKWNGPFCLLVAFSL